MATKMKCKATRFGRHRSAVAIAAMFILGASLWGNAYAADKGGAKAMDSMEMHKMEMQKSTKEMKEMESMPMTGDIDHDFAMMMKKHHETALDMANVELQHGKDPTLRGMARDIIKSQKKEIKEFEQWLAKHQQAMSEPMSQSR